MIFHHAQHQTHDISDKMQEKRNMKHFVRISFISLHHFLFMNIFFSFFSVIFYWRLFALMEVSQTENGLNVWREESKGRIFWSASTYRLVFGCRIHLHLLCFNVDLICRFIQNIRPTKLRLSDYYRFVSIHFDRLEWSYLQICPKNYLSTFSIKSHTLKPRNSIRGQLLSLFISTNFRS